MTLQRIARDIDAIVHRDRQSEQTPAEPNAEPLLSALKEAVSQRAEADARIRELLAYARAFAGPHPYTLSELAQVTGMSISGVRTAYDADDIAAVTAATGLSPMPGTSEVTGVPR